jgi:excisionase family DNA binding protein
MTTPTWDDLEQLLREETLLSPRDIAERADVPIATVYSWVNRGLIPAIKVGKRLRIRPADLAVVIGPVHSETS